MFSKILIANRGEIALRIIRACRELGIGTVAIYSEADVNSLHVRFADESICIGPPPSSSSYLSIPNIISAAEVMDVEAIHPGYGFLAENAHFAEVCESCGIRFVGPTPENIRAMGDKIEARKLMKKAGIPVIPGSEGVVKNKEEALSIVKKIGYPVMIKAAAGGGGKGMRIAHNDVSLANAFLTARTEAEASFGNPELYIEKCIQDPRHIEFQILADKFGKIIHLGERECTIQRRYQKLIEESPSSAVDKKLRKKMGDSALRAAKTIKYMSAGTVEFLLDREGHFYFMEMNTRIQVEHSVTEMVTGIDLVKEQIRLAQGDKLRYHQDLIKLNGWAIECRINAEDPENDFLPTPGEINICQFPGGPGIRVDSHIYPSFYIQPFYDSLLAKLIAHGADREEAIARMQRALTEFEISGVKTTIPFHSTVLNNPLFIRGKFSTGFIDRIWSVKAKSEEA
ncbi:MAG: acetyl-CoA carboxylase biotin carboxylase subunit [Candidatus Ratteibacteria bacterium]|nr:acetyl-CoA carboxylase biotin carboxylase subunit [Candidatus Ratteibacteria bacterium]